MVKKLFNASFEESTKIVRNLFDKKQVWYDTGARGSQNIGARIFNIIPWIAFSVISYGLGVGLPKTADDGTVKFGLSNIWYGASKFCFLEFVILGVIIFWGLLLVIHIVPKPNYLITRLFEIGNLFFILLLMSFSFIPILLGTTLGATGWLGFSIICLYGITFLVNAIHLRIEKIKQEIYGKDYALKSSYISNIWARLKKVWLIAFALIIINILTLRICMWGEFNLLSLLWLFAGPIYFGIVALFTCGPLKMFITSFYFAKYAQRYRALWQVSDEQWYGKRKAKKLAKKKLKLEKRGK